MIEAAEELGKSAGVSKACRVLAMPRSRLYRARKPKCPPALRPTPGRALSVEEKAEVHQTLNSERFQDCSPREVYATLLDEGVYLSHWRTMYRILEEHDEVHERHPIHSPLHAEEAQHRALDGGGGMPVNVALDRCCDTHRDVPALIDLIPVQI